MAIRRIATLLFAGLFIFAAQGAAVSAADSNDPPATLAGGLCSCDVSGPGFSCHFQHWIEGRDVTELKSKCAAQSNNYGVLSRTSVRERKKKKRHDD